ncbi:MAG: hypothetical protein M1318_01685 [Firmicutes bacterium]|nr:hypothetical protein [Bacillota bacterium]
MTRRLYTAARHQAQLMIFDWMPEAFLDPWIDGWEMCMGGFKEIQSKRF